MSAAPSSPRVIIAGGGTGGHVFPGLAVADSLRVRGAEVLFVGTARGLEARVVPEHGYPLETLDVEPMKGGGGARFLRGGIVAAKAVAAAFPMLRSFRPHVVLSVGGYAAGPVSLAGTLQRVPLALFEPNRVLGFTNRVLAPLAAQVYVGFEAMIERMGVSRTHYVGVPLRPGFVRSRSDVGTRSVRRVLILGGSQGAEALNEAMPEVLAALAPSVDLEIVHQSGKGRDEATKARYNAAGLTQAHVSAFLEEMPKAMAHADLIVARSGASTVAEICAVGRASILVPFPHAADDHQWANAKALEDVGGCVAIRQHELSTRLGEALKRLLLADEARTQMAECAGARGRPDSADLVADDLLRLARLSLG